MLKKLHLVFGITVFFVFVMTGQYMDKRYAHLHGMPDLQRMLFRSRHIYILLSALVNVALGSYLRMEFKGWSRLLQIAGSAVVVIATGLLIAAFLQEPFTADLSRTPMSQLGLYLILMGTAAHAIAGAATDRDL